MTEPYRLRILHLSDLHARVALDWMSDERKRLIRSQKAMRERVLGESLEATLTKITAEAPVDALCFTGDIADWGLAEEYDQARAVLQRVLTLLKLEPGRLFLVPGNHDVNRKTEEPAWSALRKLLAEREDVGAALGQWVAGAGAPPDVDPTLLDRVLKRLESYWTWIGGQLNRRDLLPCPSDGGANHPTLGFRVTVKPDRWPFPLHIIGLNSGWLCGDDHDKGKVIVTREQVDWLCHEPNGGKPLEGFRLALMHHSLGDLADRDSAEVGRTLADTVDLLLHGHRHDPNVEAHVDPDRTLRILGAGSLYEGDKGDRFFNSFHVIDVWLNERGRDPRYDVTFYGWSDRGFWHRTDAIYSTSQHGKLSWSGPAPSPDAAAVSSETLRNAWHPPGDLKRRGVLTPGRFTINSNYQSDGNVRWEKSGDVLVSLDQPPTPDWIYLVPSRNAPKRFHEPKRVRRNDNKGPKKRVIERFVKSVGGRPLDGFWFSEISASDDVPRVYVYAKEFDDFLNENATMAARSLVYISYKSTDAKWRLRLREILDADGRIEVWDDSKLAPSRDYRQAMMEAVGRARIMIILASAEYLEAPLPTELELNPAIAAADAKELSLLWVPVRAFDWQSSVLGRFMAPLDPRVALESMTDAEWASALYALYTAVCTALGLKSRPKPPESFVQKLRNAKLV